MLEAVNADEKDKFDADHRLLAWQTALLMNATGNYKKTIKVETLLGETAEDVKGENNRVDRDEKNRKLEELKNKFK